VLLPDDVCEYVNGMTRGECSLLEKDRIEARVVAFHDVPAPFTIVFRHGVARLMESR